MKMHSSILIVEHKTQELASCGMGIGKYFYKGKMIIPEEGHYHTFPSAPLSCFAISWDDNKDELILPDQRIGFCCIDGKEFYDPVVISASLLGFYNSKSKPIWYKWFLRNINYVNPLMKKYRITKSDLKTFFENQNLQDKPRTDSLQC